MFKVMDKLEEWMLRSEIWAQGFREAYVGGAHLALYLRGIKGARVYKRDFLIMILYKNRTILFDMFDFAEGSRKWDDFPQYVYDQLELENWQ